MITITPRVYISEDELTFAASRSGGPGGQNVNKVSTRVTLRFDVDRSASLTPEQKDRLRSRLGRRISKEGILQVVAQPTRSQQDNRAAAIARFVELLQEALKQIPVRKKTKVSRGAHQRRLEGKKVRSRIKERRRAVGQGE